MPPITSINNLNTKMFSDLAIPPGALVVAIIAIFLGSIFFIRWIRKILFFRGKDYKDAHDAMLNFFAKTQKLLKDKEEIGREGAESLVNEVSYYVNFLVNSGWTFSDNIVRALNLHRDFVQLAEIHDKDVFFNSPEYYSANSSVLAFFVTSENLIKGHEPIGEDRVNKMLTAESSSVGFLKKARWFLPADVSKSLERYKEFGKLAKIHDIELSFLRIVDAYREALRQDAYIPHSVYSKIIEKHLDLYKRVKTNWHIFPETPGALTEFSNAEDSRKKHNAAFVEKELWRCREYFTPLDVHQRTACVIDEDATLVIAGAGSGKTSTILKKVTYLVEERGVSPQEILLISFTKKSAEDIAKRLEKHVNVCETFAQTFHKFGLDIVKNFGHERVCIVKDPETFLKKHVHSILHNSNVLVPEDYGNIVKYFAYYFNPSECLRDETMGDFINRTRSMNFETLRSMSCEQDSHTTIAGEKVKSLEELLIANFLFLNGVSYEYEKEYPLKKNPSEKYQRKYYPDFTLTDYDGVYLEHYAIGHEGKPPNVWPEVEQRKYLDQMKWKRELHQAQGTNCIESFSWWKSDGILFDELEKALLRNGIQLCPRDPQEIWYGILENSKNQLDEFEKLVCVFINLFKSNNFDIKKFDEWLERRTEDEFEDNRRVAFLLTVRKIYEHYEATLKENGEIDFNDMINLATKIIRSGDAGKQPYRYVIVDEFQDIAVGRMQLLLTLMDNTGAHLFCVGDDWQSIFRFAGSDVNLFTRFETYFPHCVERTLENTYRNSQQLINIIGEFVMKNPGQKKKKLASPLSQESPIIPVKYPHSDLNAEVSALKAALDNIVSKVGSKKINVFLIGRTKYDEEKFNISAQNHLFALDGSSYKLRAHPNVRLRFTTVHSSKGLEADYIILLNARNDLMGFPNRIADDPLLKLVLTSPEDYEFAEERRLFYVALTRTKKQAYVLMPDLYYSPFMDELFKLGIQETISVLPGKLQTNRANCPRCKKGILVERKSGDGHIFRGCSNYPRCDYTTSHSVNAQTPLCPKCGGFLVPRKNGRTGQSFLGCSNYPVCTFTRNSTY